MIKIFTTGGTIDKIYFDAKSKWQIGEPQVKEILEGAGVGFDYEIQSVLKKDSLDLNEKDLAEIYAAVVIEKSEKILITHGTDTMLDTAKKLLPIKDKTIVLVGAMQPAIVKNSDSPFNLGFALAAAQLLQNGIYVAMNGKIFDPLNSMKNVDKSRFEVRS